MHYNHQSPGIDLITVGKCCPNLTEFSVCDSLVTAPNLMIVHASYRLFSHLFSLKLLRVSYSHQDDWEAIPRQVTFLLKIHSRVEGILNKSEKKISKHHEFMKARNMFKIFPLFWDLGSHYQQKSISFLTNIYLVIVPLNF